MKPSEDVYQLITSLTRLERGYFSKYASVHVKGEENNYKKLFEVLCSMEEYSNEKLKKRVKQDSVTGYLSTAKNQLYHTVLRTMRAYTDEHSMDSKIADMLRDIDFLHSKTLFRQARKMTGKAKQICLQNEKSLSLLELSRKEMRSWMDDMDDPSETLINLEEIRKMQIQHLRRMENIFEYEFLFNRAYVLFAMIGKHRSEKDRKRFHEIFEHELLKDELSAISTEAKLCWNNIHALRSHLENDWQNMYRYLARVISLIECKQENILKFPVKYLSGLFNYAHVGMNLSRKKEVLHTLQRLRRLPHQHAVFKNDETVAKIFFGTAITELCLYQKSGDYKKGMEVLNYFEVEAPDYEDKITMRPKLNFYLRASIIAFSAGDLQKAKNWLMKITSVKYENHNREFVSFIRLYYLILHYELENRDHLIYAVRSAKRRMMKDGQLHLLEELLVNFIKVNVFRNKKPDYSYSFAKLHDELMILRHNPDENKPFDYFDFCLWTNARLRNISIQKLAAEHQREKSSLKKGECVA